MRVHGLIVLVALAAGLFDAVPARAAIAPATVWSNPISPWIHVGYGFGTYVGGCGGAPKRHTGRDLRASVGQQIRAAANGKIHATFYEAGVGWTTLVEHNVPYEGTVMSRYSHVVPRSGYGAGRAVSRGEVIATVTSLGSNTHFAFNVYTHPYELWSWRGYLPSKPCGGDPAFPHHFVDPVRYLYVHSDVKPPVTRAVPKSSAGSHRAGWTRGTWYVTFACSDDRAGCLGTEYRLDGGPVRPAPKTLAISGEGKRVLYYRSVDRHHNVEAWRGPMVMYVDRTAPSVQTQTPASPVFPSSDFVQVDATASDPAGGNPLVASGVFVVRFYFCRPQPAAATCNVVVGTKTASGWTGRPSADLAPGAYEAWGVAEDNAANLRASSRVAFTVLASTATTTAPGESDPPAPL